MTEPAQHEDELEVAGVNETIAVVLLPEADELGCTETANSIRFQELYHNIARYVTDLERWALWNGKRWEMDVLGDLKVFALTLGVVRQIRVEAADASDEPGPNNSPSPRARLMKWATSTESVGGRRAMMKAAASLPALQTTSDNFDARGDVLGCETQLIHLAPKKIIVRPMRRADMIMNATRVCYRPEVLAAENTPDLIKIYLETFMPDETRQKLVFKALGSCLIGGNSHRLFIIIQGESTTGKTQLVEAIYEMLGPDYATIGSASVFRGNLDDKPRPDILKAVPRRIAFFSEASKAWELHGDRVKDLTGGGTITARGMHQDDFHEVRPNFTPVLVTNALPKIIGADPALLRRMIVFDFNLRPLIEDPTIRDRFVQSSEVHEWLLARLIKGYTEAATEGLGDVLVAQGLATMEAFENLTHLGAFFRWLTDTEQLIVVPEEDQAAYGVKSTYVSLKEMFDRYSYWVKEYGGKRDVAERLDYEGFNEQLKNNGWERVKSGVWRWTGKRLISLMSLMTQSSSAQ